MNADLKALKIGVLSRSPILNGKNSDGRKKVCTKKDFSVFFVVTKVSILAFYYYAYTVEHPSLLSKQQVYKKGKLRA